MKPGAITALVFSGDHIHSRVLWDSVKKAIYGAIVWSARAKMDHDRCVDFLGGEDVAPIIKSSHDGDDSQRNQCQFSICPTL